MEIKQSVVSQNVRILVIDGIEINRLLIKKMLENRHAKHIFLACNSEEALTRIQSCVPDIIILNLFMPETGGVAFVETLRKKAEYHKIPIIVLANANEKEAKRHIFISGANDFINEPLDIEELILRVNTHLTHKYQLDALDNYAAMFTEEQTLVRSIQQQLWLTDTKLNAYTSGYGIRAAQHLFPGSLCNSTHSFCCPLSEHTLMLGICEVEATNASNVIDMLYIQSLTESIKEKAANVIECFNYFSYHITKTWKSHAPISLTVACIHTDTHKLEYIQAGNKVTGIVIHHESDTPFSCARPAIGERHFEVKDAPVLPFPAGSLCCLYGSSLVAQPGQNNILFSADRFAYHLHPKSASNAAACPRENVTNIVESYLTSDNTHIPGKDIPLTAYYRAQ